MLTVALRGYFAALAAGNLVFWGAGLLRSVVLGSQAGAGFAGLIVLVVITLVVSLLLTILPFALFCTLALVFAIRHWSYFVLCGMAMGLAITGLLVGAQWMQWQAWLRYSMFWQHLGLSGAVGGWVYWRVAVRPRDQAAALTDAML